VRKFDIEGLFARCRELFYKGGSLRFAARAIDAFDYDET